MFNSSMIENFMLLSLAKQKKFLIQINEDTYNLMLIDKNLLLKKNKKVDKEIKLILVAT